MSRNTDKYIADKSGTSPRSAAQLITRPLRNRVRAHVFFSLLLSSSTFFFSFFLFLVFILRNNLSFLTHLLLVLILLFNFPLLLVLFLPGLFLLVLTLLLFLLLLLHHHLVRFFRLQGQCSEQITFQLSVHLLSFFLFICVNMFIQRFYFSYSMYR